MTETEIMQLLEQDRSLRLVVIDDSQFAAIARQRQPGWVDLVNYTTAVAARKRLLPLFSFQNTVSYGIKTIDTTK